MALIQQNATEAAELGREMREGVGGFLNRRRKGVGLCLAGIASLGVVTLYQTGILKHLPDPPLPGFNADKIHGSAQAYRMLALPDAVLAVGSYAVTLGLLAMSGAERAMEHPWVPVAAAGKAAIDCLLSAKLTADQATKLRALSIWSLIVAATTFATLPLAIPEARGAMRRLIQ
jgi:vitamin K epoxide reductase family protein